MESESTDGYSAWISIDNVKLPQYGREVAVTTSGKKEVSCWIASEVDKQFVVSWLLPRSREQMLGKLWIDGRGIRNQLGPLPQPRQARPIAIQTTSYERVSETSVRPLVFSKRELTDDDTHVDENPEHLGDIRLDIWIIRSGRKKSHTSNYDKPRGSAKTHERSKKATVSHHVALGEEYTNPKCKHKHRHKKIRLVISFVFKYRPRDFLQAEGIIPPAPEPHARSHKRAAEILELSDSDDDHDDMLKRQKEQLQLRKEELLKEELRVRNQESELQARLDRVEAKRYKKRMKLEPQPAASLELKTEVIDLT